MFRLVVLCVWLAVPPAVAGELTLFRAAAAGDAAAVERLLASGVPIDAPGPNAETPLLAAALAGQVEVAKRLITGGAKVMARNRGGLTPLHAAAYGGNAEVAELLLDHGAVLEDRANVSGTTPLIIAAEQDNIGVAELLLARGADLTIPDRDGFTAVSQAWAKKRDGMVRLLKSHGAICQPADVLGSEDYYQQCVEAGT